MGNNFSLIRERELPEQNGMGYVYRHKSGAKLIFVKNNDENRVFSITFKTPADNDTGAFHILEHCVLCGSEKYRMKDPFNELSKGTLHTYLNAMTYDDKTMYPVAGVNEKDFYKMVDVYADAVFFPLIYERKEFFMQEGWHIALDGDGKNAVYNGIVYSEMTGAYSEPEDALGNLMRREMFKQAGYRYDSGGNPAFIPTLSYEEFLAYHRKYYPPSNAHIYLYGDLDIEKYLDHLDGEYLSRFTGAGEEISIPVEPLRGEPVRFNESSPSIEEGKRFLGLQILLREETNPRLVIAMETLSLYLFKMAASPLKEAFATQGTGEEVVDMINFHMTRPMLEVVVKNAAVEAVEFEELFRGTLEEIIKNGIDKKLMEGCLNKLEFNLREENYGYRPKGLHYNIIMASSWLYGKDPFDALDRMKILNEIRGQVENGFFEKLIKAHLLDNMHYVVCEMKGGGETQVAKPSVSVEDTELIKAEQEMLRVFHAKSGEIITGNGGIKEIPLLDIADIRKEAEEIPLLTKEIGNVPVLHTPLDTRGIAHMTLVFDTSSVSEEELPVIGLLTCLLGKLDTANYSYAALSKETTLHLGGILFTFNTYSQVDGGGYNTKLVVKTKALYAKMPLMFSFAEEIIQNTLFEDSKRIKTLLTERKSKMDGYMISHGHSAAIERAYSYFNEGSRYADRVEGIGFYHALTNLLDGFEDKFDKLKVDLYRVSELIFNAGNTMLQTTMDEKGYTEFSPLAESFLAGLPSEELPKPCVALLQGAKNEAFITTAGVWYNVAAFCFDRAYHGSMSVLANILNGEYLMQELRLKGGAYGFRCGFRQNGTGYFYSYRDPHVKRTYDVYANAGEYIALSAEITDRELQQAVLGTINGMDRPISNSDKGGIALSRYLCGIKQEDVIRQRKQILAANGSEIKELVGMLEYIAENHYKCTFGGKEKIEKHAGLFERTEKL